MKSPRKVGVFFLILIVVVIVVASFMGWYFMNTLSMASNPQGSDAIPVPTSIIVPNFVVPVTGPTTETTTGDPTTQDELDQIDKALNDSITGSVAYNAPTEISLDGTVTIELLLNPSISEDQLVKEFTEIGSFVWGQAEITPRMKAELISSDRDAFSIQTIHADPVQIVSGKETTKWSWYVTARKSGEQRLVIVLYRYVKYADEAYWREVETYRSDIDVKVTLLHQLKTLDWKWIAGIIVTALLIPGFWRWYDQRRKHSEETSKPKQQKKKTNNKIK